MTHTIIPINTLFRVHSSRTSTLIAEQTVSYSCKRAKTRHITCFSRGKTHRQIEHNTVYWLAQYIINRYINMCLTRQLRTSAVTKIPRNLKPLHRQGIGAKISRWDRQNLIAIKAMSFITHWLYLCKFLAQNSQLVSTNRLTPPLSLKAPEWQRQHTRISWQQSQK